MQISQDVGENHTPYCSGDKLIIEPLSWSKFWDSLITQVFEMFKFELFSFSDGTSVKKEIEDTLHETSLWGHSFANLSEFLMSKLIPAK